MKCPRRHIQIGFSSYRHYACFDSVFELLVTSFCPDEFPSLPLKDAHYFSEFQLCSTGR